ncbi:MAG: hypothetical protein GY854_25600 [Deltaproteobacteria bacterium]|nr:hypothetical protein [Deltaproteobacteria bacterium]
MAASNAQTNSNENSVNIALNALMGLEDERQREEEEEQQKELAEQERRLEASERQRLENEAAERRAAEEERLVGERRMQSEEEARLREVEENRARLRFEAEARARAEVDERMMHELDMRRVETKTKRKVSGWTWAVATIVIFVNVGVMAILHSRGLTEARQQLETEKSAWERWRKGIDEDLAGARRDFMDIRGKVDAARNETAGLRILLEKRDSVVVAGGTRNSKTRNGIKTRTRPTIKRDTAAVEEIETSTGFFSLDEDPIGKQDLFGEDRKKKRR